MKVEEIREALSEAMALKPPRRRDYPDEGRSAFVSRLEDYLLDTAYVHATLEEARHYLAFARERLLEEWEELAGWEQHLPRKPADRITEADRNRAKAFMYPDRYADGKEARMLLDSIKRQIDRFEWESQWIISRAYTMISGSS